jgi:HTH-type transcriptional regulator, transcriptional repressor of NAD biosynthesis genes
MHRHRHALVVGKFAPLHRGHQFLIDAARSAADQVTIVVWSNPDFPDMPNDVRAGWLRTLYPEAYVVIGHDGPPNVADDDVHRAYTARVLAEHGRQPDVVFTSEKYGPPLAAHHGIAHVSVDQGRSRHRVSGTQVRVDLHAHQSQLEPLVYAHFVEKVAILGAESTGKSKLAEAAAERFRTVHVPEYGRVHYEERGGVLDLDDYVEIAQRHRALEDEAALHANRWLFVDTNAITTMFFSHYYNRDSVRELRALASECNSRYRHTVVCHDDIDFEQDGWRDNAVWRARMHGMVLQNLAVRGIEHATVFGPLPQRLTQLAEVLDGRRLVAPPHMPSLGPRPGTGEP